MKADLESSFWFPSESFLRVGIQTGPSVWYCLGIPMYIPATEAVQVVLYTFKECLGYHIVLEALMCNLPDFLFGLTAF